MPVDEHDRELTAKLDSLGEIMNQKAVPAEIRLIIFGYVLQAEPAWDITAQKSPPDWVDSGLEDVWWNNTNFVLPETETISHPRLLNDFAHGFFVALLARDGKPCNRLTVEVGISFSGDLRFSQRSFGRFFEVWFALQRRQELTDVRVVFDLGEKRHLAPEEVAAPLKIFLLSCCSTLSRFHDGTITLEQLLDELDTPHDTYGILVERVKFTPPENIAVHAMAGWASRQPVWDWSDESQRKAMLQLHLLKVGGDAFQKSLDRFKHD